MLPVAIGQAAQLEQFVILDRPASGKAGLLQGPGSTPTSLEHRPTDVRTASASRHASARVSSQERLRPTWANQAATSSSIPTRPTGPGSISSCTTARNPSGNYDQIDAEHRKVLGYDGCGYHFVIGNGRASADGQIEVAQRWVNQKHGVHCRNAKNAEIDEYGIGICFVGDLDKEPPTPRQVAAAKALVAYLGTRYTIAASRVETHAHLAATPTVCPGKLFPTSGLRSAATSTGHARATARVLRAASRPWRVARRPARVPIDRALGLGRLEFCREAISDPHGCGSFHSHMPHLSRTASCSRAITVMESVISPRRSMAQASSQSTRRTCSCFGPLGIARAWVEPGGPEDVGHLVADRVGEVRGADQLEPAGGQAGLLAQLAPGGLLGRLAARDPPLRGSPRNRLQADSGTGRPARHAPSSSTGRTPTARFLNWTTP